MKKCKWCGEEFTPHHHTSDYCSDECRKNQKTKRERDKIRSKITKPEIECLLCGKKFIPEGYKNLTRIKYCSDYCRNTWNDKKRWDRLKKEKAEKIEIPQKRECEICGKEFLQVHKGHKHTCSPECNIKRQHLIGKSRREEIRKALFSVPRICEFCSKEYLPNMYHQKYCSDKCQQAYKKAREREKFNNLPDEEKNRIISSRSMKYRYKRFRENYVKCLERDNDQCVLCGGTEKIVVHHLDGKGEKIRGVRTEKQNNELSNLITLCDSCHFDFHKVFLLKINGEWVVRSKAFEKLGLRDSIKID